MEHQARRQWSRNGYTVIDCLNCGYRHLFPFPTPEELRQYYREHYHRVVKSFPYEKLDDAYVERQRHVLASNREFNNVFSVVSKHLCGIESPSMLDIGCGNNLLLAHFIAKGWRGRAIEPNRDAATYLRRFGIEVTEDMVEELDDHALEPVHFVNLQFVLEHVADPVGLLRMLAKKVVPGGILRVTVPNDFSPGQLAWLNEAGVEPPWISYPDHVNYFDFESLSRLLDKVGLVVVDRHTNFPLEWLLMTGNDYYTDEAMRAKVGAKVAGFERAWLQSGRADHLDALYRALAGLGMGRSATLYATPARDL